jgi:hypothetical protein
MLFDWRRDIACGSMKQLRSRFSKFALMSLLTLVIFGSMARHAYAVYPPVGALECGKDTNRAQPQRILLDWYAYNNHQNQGFAFDNFSLSDVTVTNGTAGRLLNDRYNPQFWVTPQAPGRVTINIPANLFKDPIDGYNIASSCSFTYAPGPLVPTLVSSASPTTAISPIPVSLHFKYELSLWPMLTVNMISIVNAIPNGPGTWTSPNDFSFTVTPVAQSVTLIFPAGAVTDSAGNVSDAVPPLKISYTGTIDPTAVSTYEQQQAQKASIACVEGCASVQKGCAQYGRPGSECATDYFSCERSCATP